MGLIFLTGMPGAGKTTIARLLAERLSWSFVDLDAEIERLSGKTIVRLFAENGELAFRDVEAEALRTGAHKSDVVIALGAGALERDESYEFVTAHGIMVYISAPIHTLQSRLQGASARPLLAVAESADSLRSLLLALYQRRRARYESAQLVYVNDGRATASEAAKELAELVTDHGRN